MNRRLAATGAMAIALVAAVAMLRSGTPRPQVVTGPDGEAIRAFVDPQRVSPPVRPGVPPRPPGELRLDERRGGTLLAWPPGPHGAEVRWGRAGRPLDQVSYHVTAGTTLRGLDPGRYRVEVRSVDGFGQRSPPVSAEFEVADGPPAWQRGLGFAADFGTDPALDPAHWLISDAGRACLRRDDGPHPVLVVPVDCWADLRPSSPLTLSEPDGAGVRGRIVVVTDAPHRGSLDSELSIIASPAPVSGFAFRQLPGPPGSVLQSAGLPAQTIALRVTQQGAVFEVGAGIGQKAGSGESRRLVTGMASPGALHRWELVFTGDGVQAFRNGELVAATPIVVPWREALVNLVTRFAITQVGAGAPPDPARVEFVGLTGPAPDGRPVRVFELDLVPGTTVATEGAVAGRLVGFTAPVQSPLVRPIVLDLETATDRRQISLPRTDNPVAPALVAEVPVELLTGRLRIGLRSPSGVLRYTALTLELTYPVGTDVRVAQPEVVPTGVTAPNLKLLLHSPETTSVLSDGERTKPEEHQTELLIASPGHGPLVPWLAVQVDLDGRRVLTMPTAQAGPAAIGRYELTIDLSGLPAGMHQVTVTLVPDRPGVSPAKITQAVRLG